MSKVDLSIVVPLFNEEDCVRYLHEAIVSALDPLNLSYEIIFVDDGSKDGTFELAKELATKDMRLKVIKLRRNYGQTPAMAAGIDHAKGDILITMDGDLQNDPSDIPLFLEKIEEGNDIVCGWRHKRQDKLLSRKIPSIVANWIIGKITGVPIKDNGCSLKAYRSRIIKSVPLYSDMHRFIPAMASLAGTQIAEIKVTHHPRKYGVSKYGISRIYKVIIDLLVIKMIISFGERPLRFYTTASLISVVAAAVLFITSFNGIISGNYDMDFMIGSSATLFLILSFFLFLVGLLCELAIKTGEFVSLESVKRLVE